MTSKPEQAARQGLLLCSSLFLFSPAASDSFGDALASLGSKISLFPGGLSSTCGSGCFPGRGRASTSQQSPRLLQLGNLAIDLCQNI